MKQLAILLFVTLFTQEAFCQSFTRIHLKGRIIDKDTREKLVEATITCLNAKDTTKVALSFSDKNGLFEVSSLSPAKYILYITFLGYEPQKYPVDISTSRDATDLGDIEMKKTGFTLSQVEIIENKIPLRMVKDTLEYSADYFKTKENAVVEDLFRKVPGIQVDKDGTIRINGEIVKKVMVNGRNLFNGDDPKIVSKNLQADLIDKIQLIDQRADPGDKPGETTSRKDKIINITIRKNKLGIVSGELGAAYGTGDRLAARTNLSRFKPRQQLVLLGDLDNTNGTMDIRSIGSNGSSQNFNSGISYSEDITRKLSISTSYSIDDQKSTLERNSVRKNIVNDSSLYNIQGSGNKLNSTRHQFSAQIEYKIDSLQNIAISNQTAFSNSRNFVINNYESTGSHSQTINSGNFNNTEANQFYGTGIGLRYSKKFKKTNRSLTVWANLGKGNSRTEGFNISDNSYILNNGTSISDTINQQNNGKGENSQLFLMLNYTEPITKTSSIVFIVTENRIKEKSMKSIFNYNYATKLYDIPNDSLSNNFENSLITHLAKITWIFQKENLNYSISFGAISYNITGLNTSSKTNISSSILKFLPEANISYTLRNNKSIKLLYNKQPEFPDPSQLQPIINNSNPLYLTIGNPNLKPAITHSFDLAYNSYSLTSLRTLSIILNARLMHNQIISTAIFDSLGRQLIQPINTSGGYVFNGMINNTIPLKKRSNFINIGTKISWQKSMNSTNGVEGYNRALSFDQSLGFVYEYKKKFDVGIYGNLGYNQVWYSNENSSQNRYLSGGLSFNGNLNLPYRIIFSTNINWILASGRAEGYNTSPLILNTSISKLLFSHKQGVIKIQVYDLLKQYSNVIRNIQPAYIEDVKTNGIDRFFAISFSYFLGKNSK